MKCLIVLDMQHGLLDQGDFKEEKNNIKKLTTYFREQNWPVIFVKHIDENQESPLFRGSPGAELMEGFKLDEDLLVEKSSPNAFSGTQLADILNEAGAKHLFIAGFNTEYCCLFTAIAAQDRGFKVSFIEDCTGTVNDAETYEMPGLDIKDFIGSILNWSGAIEDIYLEEFESEYFSKQ